MSFSEDSTTTSVSGPGMTVVLNKLVHKIITYEPFEFSIYRYQISNEIDLNKIILSKLHNLNNSKLLTPTKFLCIMKQSIIFYRHDNC